MSGHQKEKLFISNSVEALIQFKKEHHSPLKLHIPLGGGGGGGGGEERVFFEAKK